MYIRMEGKPYNPRRNIKKLVNILLINALDILNSFQPRKEKQPTREHTRFKAGARECSIRGT